MLKSILDLLFQIHKLFLTSKLCFFIKNYLKHPQLITDENIFPEKIVCFPDSLYKIPEFWLKSGGLI